MNNTITHPLVWQDLLDNPQLQNLPYKIELNERGQILMSPTTNWHSLYQAELTFWLRIQQPGGLPMPECTIKTRLGERVADVAWCSYGFLERHQHEAVYSRAPEICIEVVSEGNSRAEMQEKIALYLEAGAEEVWLCNLQGQMSFFAANGELAASQLAPSVPHTVVIGKSS
jgi:Uma2 family endonuclease